jgi:hypothetical protein
MGDAEQVRHWAPSPQLDTGGDHLYIEHRALILVIGAPTGKAILKVTSRVRATGCWDRSVCESCQVIIAQLLCDCCQQAIRLLTM